MKPTHRAIVLIAYLCSSLGWIILCYDCLVAVLVRGTGIVSEWVFVAGLISIYLAPLCASLLTTKWFLGKTQKNESKWMYLYVSIPSILFFPTWFLLNISMTNGFPVRQTPLVAMRFFSYSFFRPFHVH